MSIKKMMTGFALGSLLFANVVNAEAVSAENFAALDKELQDLIGGRGGKVPGLGVVVFKDGERVYSNFFGQRNIEKNLPVTDNTRFRIASVSKMFTMMTIMQLVDEGKIDLDEDVSKYLGFELRNPNFPDTPITVRMLASHTSTLRDGENYSLSPQNSIEEFFKPGGSSYENGNHFGKEDKNYFKYCNLNYGVLGTIIEKVTGSRFDVYQRKHILKQLGTNADYVVGNMDKESYENLGAIYRKRKDGVWNENFDWTAQVDSYKTQPAKDTVYGGKSLKKYKVGTNATCFSPQGGLRISFGELSNCLQMFLNDGEFNGKQIIRRDLLQEMETPQWTYDREKKNGDPYGVMFEYGLGLYRIDGGSEARLCKDTEIDFIGHSGEAYGLISGLYFTPDKKNGVAFMVNGVAVEPDENPASLGKFSNGYIWEEEIMDPVCRYIFADRYDSVEKEILKK